ncbi:MAG: TetR/AcrR family transcriptional regulator [Bdellovibrionales bacterium]
MIETKGERTKSSILTIAADIASLKGLDQMSIGDVAKAANLSRSGLFAHFQSKEQMQIAVLQFAEELFLKIVIAPCEKASGGFQKLDLLRQHWPGWFDRTEHKMRGGCIFLTAIFEFDDQKGPVRDFLIDQQQRLQKYIGKCFEQARQEGVFGSAYDKFQFAYEFYSLYMGYHYGHKFFGDAKALGRFNKAIDLLFERAKK